MAKARTESGVRSVQHALDVLEAIAFSGEEIGVTRLAEQLGITKGSVHRHLTTFVERGYLTQNAITTRYGIGPKCRLLARLVPEVDIAHIAEGSMRDLRNELGHSVVLSAMTPGGALVLLTVISNSPIEIGVRPGSELAFHASAQGKVLLAFAQRPMQERILSRPLQAFTDKTVTDRNAIEDELARIVKQGYASAPEEAVLGVNAIAAPIFDEHDNCIASVAMVGSIQFLTAEPAAKNIAALIKTGQQISRRLGHGQTLPSASRAHQGKGNR